MATDTIVEEKKDFDLVAVFRAAAPETREQKFWITLGAALALHSLLLISLIHAAPRQIGDPNSAPDAVSVSFVTEAELRDATTGADGGGAAPAPEPPPPPPPTPQEQQPPTPPTPPEPPQAQPQPAEAPPPPPAPKQETEPAEAVQPKSEQLAKAEQAEAPETPLMKDTIPADVAPEKKAEETKESKEVKETKEATPKEAPKTEAEKPVQSPQELAKERPDLLDLPATTTPVERPRQKQQQPAKPQQKQAMRQEPSLSVPQNSTSTPSYEGRSAGVQRPAGITRSGANDDFARGVIRALRKTMPQMNVLGQVTVKILINLNGNIESVDVLARSENTDLNRAIVFSTKQASFPFPPPGATTDDRTFTITYIYH